MVKTKLQKGREDSPELELGTQGLTVTHGTDTPEQENTSVHMLFFRGLSSWCGNICRADLPLRDARECVCVCVYCGWNRCAWVPFGKSCYYLERESSLWPLETAGVGRMSRRERQLAHPRASRVLPQRPHKAPGPDLPEAALLGQIIFPSQEK